MVSSIVGVSIFQPLFSIRDPESFGVRLSFLLPPPRTLLGALARGIGVILGFGNGEELLSTDREHVRVRDVLTYAVEISSLANLRPLSRIIKSSQIQRIVPGIEEGKTEEETGDSGWFDAFKCDIIMLNSVKALFFVNVDKLSGVLSDFGLEIKSNHLLSAVRMIDRIGQSENICYVKEAENLSIARTGVSTINTYSPYSWGEFKECIFQRLLTNLLTLKIAGERIKEDISIMSDKELRLKKIAYSLPIKSLRIAKGREIFKPVEIETKPKNGFVTVELSDSTKVLLPESFLE